MAETLTPLAQVLSYEAPSFNNRIGILREEAARLRRNKELRDMANIKLQMEKELLQYRYELETEQQKELQAAKSAGDLQTEIVKAQAKLLEEQQKSLEEQRKELAATFKQTYVNAVKYIENTPFPIVQIDPQTMQTVVDLDGTTYSVQQATDILNKYARAAQQIQYIDDVSKNSMVAEQGVGDTVGLAELARYRERLANGDFSALDLVDGMQLNFKQKNGTDKTEELINNISGALSQFYFIRNKTDFWQNLSEKYDEDKPLILHSGMTLGQLSNNIDAILNAIYEENESNQQLDVVTQNEINELKEYQKIIKDLTGAYGKLYGRVLNPFQLTFNEQAKTLEEAFVPFSPKTEQQTNQNYYNANTNIQKIQMAIGY